MESNLNQNSIIDDDASSGHSEALDLGGERFFNVLICVVVRPDSILSVFEGIGNQLKFAVVHVVDV